MPKPSTVPILDLYHALEHLYALSNALFGTRTGTPQATRMAGQSWTSSDLPEFEPCHWARERVC